MIPNGYVEIIIHLNDLHCNLFGDAQWAQSPDYLILGLLTRPYEVRFSGTVSIFAIRFKPEGIYNIFGIPASEFKDGFDDIGMILGHSFRSFCHRLREEKSTATMVGLTENFLLNSLQRNNLDYNYLNLAAEIIRQKQEIKIEELSNRVAISQRQLEREFKKKLGVSPKHYLRIMRLNEVQRLLKERPFDLTSIAYHCGYTDQAHFIRDFKKIIGENPTIFLKGNKQYLINTGAPL
jgi:AraC-like DNA-binding protein